ncbi:hypothetical protein D3C81_1993580 [compost metagenome]
MQGDTEQAQLAAGQRCTFVEQCLQLVQRLAVHMVTEEGEVRGQAQTILVNPDRQRSDLRGGEDGCQVCLVALTEVQGSAGTCKILRGQP